MEIVNQITEIFSYGFVRNALVSGIFTAVSCSILGVFLVLKKYSFIGDGLAHVSFASVAFALLLGQSPFFISIPVVAGASFLILLINEKANINGDAAIGLVSSTAIATGVIIASISKGFNVDLFSYLFGSILMITETEVIMSIIISILIITIIFLFYNELFLSTFDEDFAVVSGIKTKNINYLISIITSVTIVIGIRIVGTMLISSLIIFPAVTALQIAKGFKQTILYAAAAAVFSVVTGIIISFMLDIPTGATIVAVNAVLFTAAFVIKKV